ncbi:relaxase/mobilization nuclease domain-containing protein [Oscillospiraceae bacterium OttesenSCG-928-G22]|nr:relaxase/mobilization nuclease domain-containing protein [Oscillospiraceae bacterium OttesenSCG-928-G22]
MATTSIWHVKHRLDRVLDYVVNPEKTRPDAAHGFLLRDLHGDTIPGGAEVLHYVTGINCTTVDPFHEMEDVKRRWKSAGGRIAYHGYQAFADNENITPEEAHQIGTELAARLWGERFQVIVATHLDRGHVHTHFVINSVCQIPWRWC